MRTGGDYSKTIVTNKNSGNDHDSSYRFCRVRLYADECLGMKGGWELWSIRHHRDNDPRNQ